MKTPANGGADPLVRAGPPGPVPSSIDKFHKEWTITSNRPTWAWAADQGVRPTWHWSIRDQMFSTVRARHAKVRALRYQSDDPSPRPGRRRRVLASPIAGAPTEPGSLRRIGRRTSRQVR